MYISEKLAYQEIQNKQEIYFCWQGNSIYFNYLPKDF